MQLYQLKNKESLFRAELEKYAKWLESPQLHLSEIKTLGNELAISALQSDKVELLDNYLRQEQLLEIDYRRQHARCFFIFDFFKVRVIIFQRNSLVVIEASLSRNILRKGVPC